MGVGWSWSSDCSPHGVHGRLVTNQLMSDSPKLMGHEKVGGSAMVGRPFRDPSTLVTNLLYVGHESTLPLRTCEAKLCMAAAEFNTTVDRPCRQHGSVSLPLVFTELLLSPDPSVAERIRWSTHRRCLGVQRSLISLSYLPNCSASLILLICT